MTRSLPISNRPRTFILLLFTGLIVFINSPLTAQTQADNLAKYWRYRDRLRDEFVYVSSYVEEFGNNLPGTDRYTQDGISRLSWGDANNMMNHYLTLLATELWLLKNNDQPYQQTLSELVYAMLAIERLDLYSESVYRGYVDYANDRNGMYNRDDVTTGFMNTRLSHFGVQTLEANGIPLAWNGFLPPEEISQDNMYHTIEGLAVIAKLIGTESIQNVTVNFYTSSIPDYMTLKGIKSGYNINFTLWAQDIIRRYIWQFQRKAQTANVHGTGGLIHIDVPWVLINPVTDVPVREGSGMDLDAGIFFNSGLIKVGEEIVGENLRTRDPFLFSPTNSLGIMQNRFGIGPNPFTIPMPWPFSDITLPINDDGIARSLSTTSNIIGDNTFWQLRAHRDNTTAARPYEQLPLYSLILYDDNWERMIYNDATYNNDTGLYTNLFDAAPSLLGGGVGPNSNHNTWGSSSRLIWPEKVGVSPDGNYYEYSGMDYMVLHNLYYASFRREDFRNVVVTDNFLLRGLFSIGNHYYRRMELSLPISSSANTTYSAPAGVYLKAGFRAPAGAQLTIKAQPRPTGYNGTLYKKPGGGGGREADFIHHDMDPGNEVYNIKTQDAATAFETATVKPTVNYVDRNKERVFTVSPNPVRGTMFVNGPADLPEGSSFELLSVTGQVLHKADIVDSKQSLDVSHLSSGTYIVKIFVGEQVTVKKISVIN